MGLKKAVILATSGLIIICKGAVLPLRAAPRPYSVPDELSITASLIELLSPNTSISTQLSLDAPQGSEYRIPRAGLLFNVAIDTDVAATIKFCDQHGLRFLAQSGGNSWADRFSLPEEDVLINLCVLNEVLARDDRTTVEISGGTRNDELIAAAE